MTSGKKPLLVLATDLDGTLVGHDGYLRTLLEFLDAHRRETGLVYLTGRNEASTRELMQAANLPEPDYLVTDVGSSIYRHGQMDGAWHARLEAQWDPEAIEAALRGIPGVRSQGIGGPLRLSYLTTVEIKPLVMDALSGLSVKVILSSGRDLDIVPEAAGKAGALVYLASREDWPRESVLAAGDTLNDRDMLAWAGRGVAVGNALDELKHSLPPGVYMARHPFAGGILEALALFWPGDSSFLDRFSN